MNVVSLVGNLARDVNLHESENTAYCNMTVAVSDGYGDKEITSFISCKAFGKTAENCARYLEKGRKVAITGRIQTGSYEKDGRTIYTTDVICNRVEFLGGGNKANDQDIDPDIDPDANLPKGFNEVADDDDIPF